MGDGEDEDFIPEDKGQPQGDNDEWVEDDE